MLTEIAIAIDQENYDQARELITKLPPEEDNLLWSNYYLGLIAEKENNLVLAEQKYRQILKDSIYPNPTLMTKVRDGLERIKTIQTKQKEKKHQEFQADKQTKLQQLRQEENSQELAILILRPLTIEQKNQVAPQFAQLIETDLYTAKLQLPTRSWRLHKTGSYGDLKYYQTEFTNASIPCFCYPLKAVNQIQVYQVKYIKEIGEQWTLVCDHESEKDLLLEVNLNHLHSRVSALVPIFEMSVHLDNKRKLKRKKTVLDYLQFYDLHLNKQQKILRFSDQSYQFEQGINIFKAGKTTREKWYNLTKFVHQELENVPLYSDFTSFSEGAIHFPEMLKQITSQINLFRKEETLWDEAFQLYSSLVLLQQDNLKYMPLS